MRGTGQRGRLRVLAVLVLVGLLCAPSIAWAGGSSGAGWSLVPSPAPAGSSDSRLIGVSCANAAECWAVGYSFVGGSGYQTLTEHYDGAHWQLAASPNPAGATNSYLNAVSCLPDGACWAVGYWADNSGAEHTLIETETPGTGWSIQASPDTSDTIPSQAPDDQLTGVACVSRTDCWAVGYYLTPGRTEPVLIPETPPQTLIEQYNGIGWAIVASPDHNPGSSENELNGVSCGGAGDCWAVGIYFAGSTSGGGDYRTLAENYRGSSWKIARSPSPSAAVVSGLDGINCPSPGFCTAVGVHSPKGGPDHTLAETLGSSSWAIQATQDTGSNDGLTGVTCTDPVNCWAVGEYDTNGHFLYQTLIEQRTSSGWTITPSPNTEASQSNGLESVACPAAQRCFAVGFYSAGYTNAPLIEQYAPAPTPAVPELPWPALGVALAIGLAGYQARRGRGRASSPGSLP